VAVIRGVPTQAGVIPALARIERVIGDVFSTKGGLLYCDTCKMGWCSHVETAIVEMKDSKSIWNDFAWHDQTRLVVPILPTDWFLFADALIVPNGNDFEVKVSGGKNAAIPDAYDIGMISRGDGRAQIRMMIVDWIKMIAPAKPVGLCSSTKHGIDIEFRVDGEYRTDKRAILAHAWCFKWYKKCAICTRVEGPKPSTFDPNLIPEV
jgi:hypothetical protein